MHVTRLYPANLPDGMLAGPLDRAKEILGKFDFYVKRLGHNPNSDELVKIERDIQRDMLKDGKVPSLLTIDSVITVAHPLIRAGVAAKRVLVEAPVAVIKGVGKAAVDAIGIPWPLIIIGAVAIYFGPGMLGRYQRGRAR
jgi:hypothetical protein